MHVDTQHVVNVPHRGFTDRMKPGQADIGHEADEQVARSVTRYTARISET